MKLPTSIHSSCYPTKEEVMSMNDSSTILGAVASLLTEK
jgi:hypothetical protein